MSSEAPTRSNLFRLPRRTVWTWLFGLFTAFGMLAFSYKYLDDLARQHSGTFGRRLLEEGTGVYSVFVLLPLIVRFNRKVVFRSMNWVRVAVWHVTGGIGFSLLHTSLMAVSRQILSPLFGMGPYDYGIMRYRYPMEASNDLIVYSLFTAIIYLFDRVQRAQQHELEAAELQTRLAEAKLENLRLQIHPHFLFNTLNTISSVMYEDLPAADAMLTKLSDMLRLTLCAPNTSEVALAEELKLTRLYLDLMCRRYEERLQVTYDIDRALDESLVPQLILQPLVENSLRHGFDEGRATMSIRIEAHRNNGTVNLKVSDTGAGLRGQDASSVVNRGIGLTSIRERLAQLYGEAQQFSIAENADGGVDVSLTVPFHRAQPDA